MTFCDLAIYNDNPLLIRLYTELDRITEFWVLSIEHLWRVWHADRGRLLLRTPGPVPLGLAYVLLVETNPFLNSSLFYRTMLFEYPSVLSRFCFGRLLWKFTIVYNFILYYIKHFYMRRICHRELQSSIKLICNELEMSFIPPLKRLGDIPNHHVCPSVCPSVHIVSVH